MIVTDKMAFLHFPLVVKWYVTGKCNLRCEHCYLSSYKKQAPLDKILPIIDYLADKKINYISFLGGEPLIRQDLPRIIKRCQQRRIFCKLVSNGTLLTHSLCKQLITSGLGAIQISLEGDNDQSNDRIRGLGTYQKAIKGIQTAKANGLPCSLAITLNHQNVPNLENFFQLASQLSVNELKLAAFLPVGKGSNLNLSYRLTSEDLIKIRSSIKTLHKRYPNVPLTSSFDPQIAKQDNLSFGCGAGTSHLIINSDMTLSACDLLTEQDRTKRPIEAPQDIEKLWLYDSIFRKWRGMDDKLSTKKTSLNIADQGCHVAYRIYQKNPFL